MPEMRKDVAAAYHLTPTVDFRAAIDLLGDDHLIVAPDRMLVIFRNAVLNIEVDKRDLKTAEQIAIEVLNGPTRPAQSGATLIK